MSVAKWDDTSFFMAPLEGGLVFIFISCNFE